MNERGEKRFLAIEDGVRESTQSWREVLLRLKSRGMNVPELAVGDGGHGFLGGTGRSVRWDTPATVLGAQDDERVELPAQVGPGQSQAGPTRDLAG